MVIMRMVLIIERMFIMIVFVRMQFFYFIGGYCQGVYCFVFFFSEYFCFNEYEVY